jgi:hypothetical protein
MIVPVGVLSQRQLNQINRAGSGVQAQISAYFQSVGVPRRRADSIASAAVAGAVLGGVGLCVGSGVLLAATVILIPLIPLDCAKDLILGGVPGVLVGAAVGAVRPQ